MGQSATTREEPLLLRSKHDDHPLSALTLLIASLTSQMHFMLFGLSAGTSVCAALYFRDTVKGIENMRRDSSKIGFWQRQGRLIAALMVFCIAWDAFQAYATLVQMPNFTFIAGGLTNIFQVAVALVFVKMSYRFVSFTTRALGAGGSTKTGSGPNKQQALCCSVSLIAAIRELGAN